MDRRSIGIAVLIVAASAGALGYWLAAQRGAGAPPVAAPLVVPEFRPEFTLADAEGKPHSSKEFDGQAVLFNFWATWCGPCRREIPLLGTLEQEYGARGFRVVGIAVDSLENVQAFEKELPLRYLTLQGEMEGVEVAKRFGLDLYGLPVSVLTDKTGRIVAVHTGEIERAEATALLKKALPGI